jgi:hypothetical protein
MLCCRFQNQDHDFCFNPAQPVALFGVRWYAIHRSGCHEALHSRDIKQASPSRISSTPLVTIACKDIDHFQIHQLRSYDSQEEHHSNMDFYCCDTASDQLQSHLFGKLSAEIRSMTWKEVVPDGSHNGILHIIHSLNHIQCSAPEGGYNTSRVAKDSWGTEHEHCYLFSGIENSDAEKVKQCGIFPLLLSCQRI